MMGGETSQSKYYIQNSTPKIIPLNQNFLIYL